MTNATKTLALIFVVLSVIAAGLKWSSDSEGSAAFSSDLINFDTAKVSKMVISQPTKSKVTLVKNKEQWKVSSGSDESFPADGKTVKEAIETLNQLNVNAVATRNPDKFSRYKVEDSTGTKVSLYSGDELLESVFLGAQNRRGRSINSYVRLSDQNSVYTVEGFLRPRLAKKLEDWREKTVWEVEQNNITRVAYMYSADSSFVMTKTDENQWVADADTLSSTKVSRVLSELSAPEASGFPKSPSKENFGTETYALQIGLSNDQKHRIRLKESPSDTAKYIGVSPDSPYVFSFRKNVWDENVLKSRSDLIKRK